MKNLIPVLIVSLLSSTTIFAQINSTFDYEDEGQRVCLVDVTINQNPISVSLNFLDAAMNTSNEFSIYRRFMYGNGADWELQVENLLPGTSSWTDYNVNLGEVWEYQVRRIHDNGTAFGYVCAAVYYDQSNYKGQMILVMADDVPVTLPDEVLRLKKDLTADGWFVNELIVGTGAYDFDEGAAVMGVKDSITNIYNDAPSEDKPKILFVLGHVPLPRSGQGLQPPDGHIEASGARGSDSYYADIDGEFTDTATYDISEQNQPLAKNYPGDYKWDQDIIPSELEMAFGRVNFRRIGNGNIADEMAAMKLYLDRSHDYRYILSGEKVKTKSGYYENGYWNSTDASYRCLPAISGGGNVINSSVAAPSGHSQWVNNHGTLIWYMSNQFVPFMAEWDSIGMDALVYSSDQSVFGYGDIPNDTDVLNDWHQSTIRRILSFDTKCLMAIWTTSAINVFHQAGVGEPLGYACKFIMDHNASNQNYEKFEQSWDNPDWWNRTHFNFFGDPTLRLYQTFPITNLQIADSTSFFTLEWSASPDENLVGYHVYKSEEEFGIYNKITGLNPITDTSFTDLIYQYGDWYMVRAIAERTTGSGIFLHPSQGVFIQGNVISTTHSLELNGKFIISPNPADEHLNISSDFPVSKIEIWNSQGKMIFKQQLPDINSISFDIGQFPKGLYIIKIYSELKSGVQQFIKI